MNPQVPNDRGSTPWGETLEVKTFVSRALRSGAMRGDGELELVTATAVIRGRPSPENRVSDLWHRTREQVTTARHEGANRIPDVEGGDFIELTSVTLEPFGAGGQVIAFDDLIVFSQDVLAMRSTVMPELTR